MTTKIDFMGTPLDSACYHFSLDRPKRLTYMPASFRDAITTKIPDFLGFILLCQKQLILTFAKPCIMPSSWARHDVRNQHFQAIIMLLLIPAQHSALWR